MAFEVVVVVGAYEVDACRSFRAVVRGDGLIIACRWDCLHPLWSPPACILAKAARRVYSRLGIAV